MSYHMAYELSKYSFKMLYKMDAFIDGFKQITKSFISDGAKKLIDLIKTHSIRFKGVSFMTYQYMSDKLGLSVRHLKRLIKQLVALGFIYVWHETVNGKQIGNNIVIRNDISLKKIRRMLLNQTSVTMSDTSQVMWKSTGQNMGHVTPNNESSGQEPIDDADYWDTPYPEGNTSFSSNQSNTIYKGEFPFYNWLEEE